MTFDPASYVEGVPVKIAEKFRPPRKVILPSSCNYQINTEVLTDEYDFVIENNIWKFLNDQKKYREDTLKQRQNNIKEYEEHIRKKREEEVLIYQKLKEEEEKKVEEDQKLREKLDAMKDEEQHFVKEITEESPSDGDKLTETFDKKLDCSTEVDLENSESEVVQSNNDQINHSEIYINNCDSSLVNENLSRPNNFDYECSKLNLYSQQPYPSVLVPTQCTPQTTHERSPTKKNSSINFADFEGDASDPFDSAALKSINDMEELAQILQTSNITNKSFNGAKGPYINLNYPEPRLHSNDIYPNSQFSYGNYQLPNNQFTHVPLYGLDKATHNNTAVPLSRNADMNYQSFSMQTYTPWNNLNCGSEDPSQYQYNPICYQMPQSSTVSNVSIRTGRPIISNAVSSISSECQLNGVDNDLQILPLSSQNPISNITTSLNKRQDLEDFYIRYYSPHKQQSGFRSGESTPTTHLQGAKTMRSSSSVPDLSAAEDSEVMKIVSTIEASKLNLKSSMSNPSSRSSSAVGIEGSHNIYKNLSTSPSTLQSRLHDPFSELTNDAQALVQSMAEMGFPRPRVARAIQKLGTDHKKLLEVLLILQSLQESGEDEFRSESAFYFYMGDITKVQDFLTAAKTLLDLGFEEDRVIEKLFKHQNDKDKCLEELIS